VEWLRDNTAQGDGVFTNSSYVAYASGRVADYDQVNRYVSVQDISTTLFGTIVVLTTSHNMDAEIEKSVALQQIEAIAAYPDQDDPKIIIFRRTGD